MAETPENLGAADENLVDETPADETQVDETQEGTTEEPEKKETKIEGHWPESWREDSLEVFKDKKGEPLQEKDQEKLLKRLSRYASPKDAIKALINAQDRLASGGLIQKPGKDSTPEEMAQYRKDMGIPEAPSQYNTTLDDGLVIGEEDKPVIEAFLKEAHESNCTQEQVTRLMNWRFREEERERSERFEADVKHRKDVEDHLRQEWGPEYRQNLNMSINLLNQHYDEGTVNFLMGARGADGSPLMNNPGYLSGLVAQARAANPAGALVPGSGTKQHDGIVERIVALEKKMRTDGSLKGKDQEDYLKLISARDNVPIR